MKCYCCDSENWHLRTDLNPHKPVGICKECGNIAFIIEQKDQDKMKKFYESEYRAMPSTANLITTTRKLNYIKLFLTDYLKDKKNLVCGDVGAATGYFCNYLRSLGHRATGSELTLSFRRFSEHYYGIPLTTELESKHKYDFISFYHTLEHIPEPDKVLLNNKNLLKDDGIMFISVPEWLYELIDLSAYGKLCIENYFHENHINCFTWNSFQNILNKTGLEIVKADREQYGITVLVKKCEPKPIKADNWQEINSQIDKIKKAIESQAAGKVKEALEIWPNYPDGMLRLIFDNYKKDNERQAIEFEKILKSFPNSIQIKVGYAVWLYQYNRYEESIKAFEEVNNTRPHEDYFVYIGWCLDRLGRPQEAIKYYDKAQQINPKKWEECINWVCSTCAKMPTWDERARVELEKKVYEQNKDKIKLVDEYMERNNGTDKSTAKQTQELGEKSQSDK